MNYRFTRHAEGCLDELLYYIAEDKPSAAKRFYDCVVETCEMLTELPYTGRKVEYFGNPKIRCKNVKKFGDYLIFYHIRRNEIVVSLVIHSAREEINYIEEI